MDEFHNAPRDTTISLDRSLTAGTKEFGSPSYRGITLNGKNFTLDSNNIANLKFSMKGLNSSAAITFQDITFKNFLSTDADGAMGNGGASWFGELLKVTFSGNITFIANTAANGGGGLYTTRADSRVSFTDSSTTFISNSATYGAALYSYQNSGLHFTNSTAVFISNSAGYGGAYMSDNGKFYVNNSLINFTANNAISGSGGAFYDYGGSVFSFTNSVINFTSNTAAAAGGAMRIFDGYSPSNVSFTNSVINFTSNTAGTLGGAIYSRANISFTNSTITFKNNFANGILNDVHINEADLIFSGGNVLLNGLRSTGTALTTQVRKTGAGTLLFLGDGSKIANTFSIESGTVNFKSSISSISILNIQNNTTLSLQNESAASALYISGNVNLTGVLALDINVNSSAADTLYVEGTFSVNSGSILDINRIGSGWLRVGVPIIKSANAITTKNNLSVGGYFKLDLSADNKSIILSETSPWNVFVAAFGGASSKSIISLSVYTSAADDPNSLPIGFSMGKELTIDAKNNFLDSGQKNNLGFILRQTSATFKDITFTRFAKNVENSSGAAIFVELSSLIFSGNIVFSSNVLTNIMTGGGALYLKDSQIIFSNASVSFNKNQAQSGAAIYNNAKLEFLNSIVNFTSNAAVGDGGAIYIAQSKQTVFTNSTITFTGNLAQSFPNDIYLEGDESKLIFSGDNFLPNGIRVSGAGLVEKADKGALVFAGAGSVFLSSFTISNGSVNFKSAISTVSNLNVLEGASLSLSNESSTSGFHIIEDFNLAGVLEIDVDFAKGEGDRIWVGENFKVENSTLTINILDFETWADPLIILSWQNLIGDISGLHLLQENFSLSRQGDDLLLSIINSSWNLFVKEFQKSGIDETIFLTEDANAPAEYFPLPLGESASDNFTIAGGEYILDSGGINGLGFILNGSSLTFLNIAFKNFEIDNTATNAPNGAVINAQNSNLTFLGTIIFANNNAQNFGGAVFAADSHISFIASSAAFIENRAAASGAAFYLGSGSSITFSNSTITFKNNFANGNLNDVYFYDNTSALIFSEGNFFTNGIRTSGDIQAQIIKMGGADLTFAGDPSIMLNAFNIVEGRVIFESNISTIGFLNVEASAMISLQNSVAISSLYITDDFTLNGKLAIDVDFKNLSADQIFLTDDFIVSNSTLSINLLDRGSSGTITIINMSAPADISTFYAPKGYLLRIESNNIVLNALDGAWNVFAKGFQNNMQGATIYLSGNAYAVDEILPPLILGNSDQDDIAVDGRGFILDAGGGSLGFSLEDRTVTLKNISLINFISAQNEGAAISLERSTLIFSNSAIAFENNFAGGVLNDVYLKDVDSSIIFSGSIILTNGIRTSGDIGAQIIKSGTGDLQFLGEGSKIENTFLVEAGALNFKSAVSTISVLTMQKNSTLSLGNSTLFISTLSLNANLKLDIDFE
ncbi:MAG: hypothetical protein LBC07_03290, partial [Elusimicrobiota bacterium]|nr:hypothetical protein [Elusimicrobiota bacterium]